MGLFGKKKKEVKQENGMSLAELPKLPALPPKTSGKDFDKEIHKLPSFPSSSFGTKFSQDSIKDAVKGGDKAMVDQDDYEDYEDEMVGGDLPLKNKRIKELEREVDEEMPKANLNRPKTTREAEPIFIRIDKFQEGIRMLDDTKRKISEIEHVLNEIKKTREREERELTSWESNVKSMKDHIEKLERDVFSNI